MGDCRSYTPRSCSRPVSGAGHRGVGGVGSVRHRNRMSRARGGGGLDHRHDVAPRGGRQSAEVVES